jgi:hypothetical protein
MKTITGRLSERIRKELEAQLIVDEKKYFAIIDIFVENAIKVRTVSTETDVNFLPDERVELEFEVPSGEILNLKCKVTWSSKMSPGSLIQKIGLEITEMSPIYEHYYKSFSTDQMLEISDISLC